MNKYLEKINEMEELKKSNAIKDYKITTSSEDGNIKMQIDILELAVSDTIYISLDDCRKPIEHLEHKCFVELHNGRVMQFHKFRDYQFWTGCGTDEDLKDKIVNMFSSTDNRDLNNSYCQWGLDCYNDNLEYTWRFTGNYVNSNTIVRIFKMTNRGAIKNIWERK